MLHAFQRENLTHKAKITDSCYNLRSNHFHKLYTKMFVLLSASNISVDI